MKFSKFTFVTRYPETGETLLYNTLNGALLAFEPEHVPEISALISKNTNLVINTELTGLLAESQFIIDENFDEIGVVLERNRLGIKDTNRLDVIIMPNMNCNFACVYCYEEHGKSQMNVETKEQLMAWLQKMIPQFKAVLISWFGGEPMLSYDTIIELQQKIIQICETNKVALSSHITTNGSLLNKDRIDKMLSFQIKSYQITLDGSPETHNVMRPLKGGGPTFDKIFNNICLLARAEIKAHIKLRINYDSRNVHTIKKMLQMFPADIRSRIMVVCEAIFKESFGVVIETRAGGDEIEDVKKFAQTLGYMEDNEAMEPNRLTFCYADRDNQFTLNYNGDVFKCTVQKFDSKYRLGFLNTEGDISWEDKRLDKWQNINAFEDKCYECVFMPLCMGGCRKLRAIWGTVGDDCKAPFDGFESKVRNFYEQAINK